VLPRHGRADYPAAVQKPPTSAGRTRAQKALPYAVAVFLTVAVLLTRQGLGPWVEDRPVFIIFLIPIIISAYLGGLWPGLFATAVVSLATAWFVLPPLGSLRIENPLYLAQWLFMVLEGALLSVLFAELERWRRGNRDEPAQRRHAATELKVRLGFAAALAILGTIGIVSYLSVVRLDVNSRLVARSHEVMENIEALRMTTLASESASRAFLVTGNELFAAEYTRASGRVDGLVQQLTDAVRDDAEQSALVPVLGAAIRARIARSDEVVQLRRSVGIEAVQANAAQGYPGVTLQARIRDIVHRMKVHELALLDRHEAQTRRSAATTQAVIVGGSVLALIVLGLALFAIRRDFAGRERAEGELNRFFDLSLDIFVIASGEDGMFKRASAAVTDILGYTVEEFLGIGYMELMHEDDRPRALQAVELQMRHGQRITNFEARFRHKNGEWRTLSWRSQPLGTFMYATARDVTDAVAAARALQDARDQLELRVEQRTAELATAYETLHKSERRFRALLEHGADSIALVDADNKILYLSPAVAAVEGYSPEELVGRMGPENTHPEDLPRLAGYVEQLLANPGKPIPVLWRRRHKDGRWLWLEGVATNLLDDPAVGAIVTNYRDVSERVHAEARMREHLQRLALLSRVTRAIGERQDLRSIFQVVVRTIEDELPVDFCLICLYDAGENRLSINCIGARSADAAAAMALNEDSPVPIDENGLGRCVRGDLVYEPDIAAAQFAFPARLAQAGFRSLVIAPLLVESQVFGVLICARRKPEGFSSGECEFLRQASEHIALAAHQAQLYGALQRAYDDLRMTQQQVMQQERLRALGQMASGIAHDINNAISPMALYTEALLEREPSLTERGRKQLEIIQRAIDDVAQTVARMGEFYRLREPQLALVPVDLNLLVEHVVDLTRARWSDMAQQRGAVIDLKRELDPELPKIAAVESQIRDALVNLVFNAVDAMPTGGPLTIRTRIAAGSRGQVVVLEVADRGVGMDEETKRRCLEPFFTTKGERGTGLGLAMVYGVAQRHGANLEIDSRPGEGTVVRLSFAVAPPPNAEVTGTHHAPAKPLRILIVDDDPLLLNSLRDALESDGHHVTVANGGQAGINAFVESHADGNPFPVVITDLGMPHVDGRKVAATIKGSVPATRILMLTGWGRRLVAEGDVPPGVDQVLSKPPKLVELRAALAGITS
jgi:PAS domain S-box-containing protein